MDLRGWIGQQHVVAHNIIDAEIVNVLDARTFTARPVPGANSIAWVLWHATRCEDLVVNTICRRQPQVLIAGGWLQREGLGDTRMGTGNNDAEVAGFCETVDIRALLDYRSAVRQQTSRFIREIDPAALDEKPPLDDILATIDPLWADTADWVRDLWAPWPLSLFLNFTALGHTYIHIGEMQAIRSALGVSGR